MLYEVKGNLISLMDDDDRNVIHMSEPGGYEQESLCAWAEMVQPGRVALDVGAYTGLYSIIAARLGAVVVAFEPMPRNHWRLGVNLRLNKVIADVLHVAASDGIGRVELHYNRKVPLTTGASLEQGIAHHNETIMVTRVTVDSLAFTNVAAIKVDVERHEPAVLRGAMKTIERDRPTMLIETLDTAMRDQVLDLLPDYEIAAVLDGRNSLFIPK